MNRIYPQGSTDPEAARLEASRELVVAIRELNQNVKALNAALGEVVKAVKDKR